MASLLQGTPLPTSSYVSSTQDYPKWMQDALYNQIQSATNVANTPYQSYSNPTVAELSPLQQQAYQGVQSAQGKWTPALSSAISGMQGLAGVDTAAGLGAMQNAYLQPGAAQSSLSSGQGLYGRASGIDSVAAAQPALTAAQGLSPVNAASPYFTQSAQLDAMGSAQPYLAQAGQSSVQDVSSYMNPYQQSVMDVIARQGARNLSENLLPAVSDSFVKAGQFGSNRMGEFGSRALRDSQEAILNQQSQLANQGYTQALNTSQADLTRQAQLASTAGQLTNQQQSNLTNIGQAAGQLANQQQSNLANIGQIQGSVANQYQQNLGALGQMQTNAGQAQQQAGLSAAQALQQAQAADANRTMAAQDQIAQMARLGQQMGYTDTAALDAAGLSLQQQQQQQLTAAYDQWNKANQYPQQQLDWLSTQVRGMAPSVPQATSTNTTSLGSSYSPSILSQLAGAGATYAGLKHTGVI